MMFMSNYSSEGEKGARNYVLFHDFAIAYLISLAQLMRARYGH